MKVLVVVNPFGGRAIGDRISSSDEITAVLAGENAHHVIASDHADLDEATAPPAAAASTT